LGCLKLLDLWGAGGHIPIMSTPPPIDPIIQKAAEAKAAALLAQNQPVKGELGFV